MSYEAELLDTLLYSASEVDGIRKFRKQNRNDNVFDNYYSKIIATFQGEQRKAVDALLALWLGQSGETCDAAFAEGLYIGLGLARLSENLFDVYREVARKRHDVSVYSQEVETLEEYLNRYGYCAHMEDAEI